MKYPRYPKYKDSGVEWLGEIPEEWTKLRVKHVVAEGQQGLKIGPFGSAIKLEMMVEPNRGFKVYGQENIITRDFSVGARYLPAELKENFSAYFIQPGDILVTMMGTSGRCGIVPTPIELGIIDSHLMRVRLSEAKVDKWFFYWCFDESAHTKMQVDLVSKGSIMQGLNRAIVSSILLAVPPLSTQRSIAAFLDAETARIDSLINDYEELITLLQEKRQALISHAVTRGLSELVSPDDPEFGEWAKPVKFKDSGVEWIREIPEGWCIVGLKHCCSLIKDGTHLPPERVELGIPLLSVRNVIKNTFTFLDDDSYISEDDYFRLCKSFVPQSGDVLLAIVGATLGKTAVIPRGMANFQIQRSLALIRPDESALSDFIHYWFQSAIFQSELWKNAGFSAQPGIYLGALCQFKIPKTNLTEQRAIASFLARETAKIDILLTESESAVDLLREHRSALITNAVTGKINVEGLA